MVEMIIRKAPFNDPSQWHLIPKSIFEDEKEFNDFLEVIKMNKCKHCGLELNRATCSVSNNWLTTGGQELVIRCPNWMTSINDEHSVFISKLDFITRDV